MHICYLQCDWNTWDHGAVAVALCIHHAVRKTFCTRSTFIRNKYGVECGLCAIGLIVCFDLFAVCFVNVCAGIIFQEFREQHYFDTNEFVELKKSDKQATPKKKIQNQSKHQQQQMLPVIQCYKMNETYKQREGEKHSEKHSWIYKKKYRLENMCLCTVLNVQQDCNWKQRMIPLVEKKRIKITANQTSRRQQQQQ